MSDSLRRYSTLDRLWGSVFLRECGWVRKALWWHT